MEIKGQEKFKLKKPQKKTERRVDKRTTKIIKRTNLEKKISK